MSRGEISIGRISMESYIHWRMRITDTLAFGDAVFPENDWGWL